MLTGLGLRNFKAFGDEMQHAPLAPITLIYGPNSGGKSSVMQALLLLKQSVEAQWRRTGTSDPSVVPTADEKRKYVERATERQGILGESPRDLYEVYEAREKLFESENPREAWREILYMRERVETAQLKRGEAEGKVRDEKGEARGLRRRFRALLDKYPEGSLRTAEGSLHIAHERLDEARGKLRYAEERLEQAQEKQRGVLEIPRLRKEIEEAQRDLLREQKKLEEVRTGLMEVEEARAEFQKAQGKLDAAQAAFSEAQGKLDAAQVAFSEARGKLAVAQVKIERLSAARFGLVPDGSFVNLGSMSSLTHKHDALRALEIKVSIGCSPAEGFSQLGVDAYFSGTRRLAWVNVRKYQGSSGTMPSQMGRWTSIGDVAGYTDGVAHIERSLVELFFDHLAGLTYLGPLMAPPKRFYQIAGQPFSGMGIAGENVPYVLHTDGRARESVNDWLRKFDIPYEIDAKTLGGDDDVVGNELLAMYLLDTRSKVAVTIADVGFGVNQLLPVILQGATSHGKTICVEQPEIHLHPRLQASIADLLIDTSSAKRGEDGNQWLVETHSEMIIRRIQRRIREGVLSSDDVSVLYVDPQDDGSSSIQQLRLDENGYWLDDWPDGFFDEAVEEARGFRRARKVRS